MYVRVNYRDHGFIRDEFEALQHQSAYLKAAAGINNDDASLTNNSGRIGQRMFDLLLGAIFMIRSDNYINPFGNFLEPTVHITCGYGIRGCGEEQNGNCQFVYFEALIHEIPPN